MKIELINEKDISTEEVIGLLEKQKSGTGWAKISNDWAKDRLEEFDKANDGNWVRGFLPKEFFGNILLPMHEHKNENNEGDAPFVITEKTPTSQLLDVCRGHLDQKNSECLQNVNYLKEKIRENGFVEDIILGIKDGGLYHIDGLHRIISVTLLLDEGLPYEPIPVCLSRPRSQKQ